MQAQSASQATEAIPAPLAGLETARIGAADNAVSPESTRAAAAHLDAGKPGLAKDVQTTARPAHGAGTAGSLQQVNHLNAAQSTAPSLDASGLTCDPAGTRGAANPATAAGNSGSSTAFPESATAHDTFAALDVDAASGMTRWIHAGAQRAEAGFQDPALGWVGVRAEAGSGGIHASLVPGSADAAQALSGHLAGLNSYLTEHHTPVETLTLAAASADRGSAHGEGQGMQQGAGQNNGQGGSAESPAYIPSSQPASPVAAVSEAVAPAGMMAAGGMASVSGGVHVSVMA
jgi:hypothetical protein